ncbi:MAG: ABC transporter permease, partial [Planctomycetota bacterium]
MVRALDIKLWRDLRQLWAQVLTIAVVVAIGVAGFVGMFAVYDSLLSSRDAFYRDNRFADVFVAVKRAPLAVRGRLAAVPGVAEVKTEVVFDAQVDLPGFATPVSGRFVGLDLARAQQGRQGLNA